MISPGSKYKPEVYFLANFENIQKLEELRERADMICLRKMYLKTRVDDTTGAYAVLQKHIFTFRGKIEYYDPRFKFEVNSVGILFILGI